MRVTSYAQRTSDYFYNQEDDTSLLAICVDYVVALALSLSSAVFFDAILPRLHEHRSARAAQPNRLSRRKSKAVSTSRFPKLFA
jgi:hypothetical protein